MREFLAYRTRARAHTTSVTANWHMTVVYVNMSAYQSVRPPLRLSVCIGYSVVVQLHVAHRISVVYRC